jgi:thioredoxin-dependent peroxiredoxin
MSQVQIGQLVPDFTAKIVNDKIIQLSDYAGRYVLLYFYPKDNTPGCTQQAQMFRDAIDQFTALNTVILGVSRDSVRSHENFKTKHCLPFDLIADADESLCELFDVIKMKNMYGKQVRGIERSSFLINPDRVLIQEWRKVKVNEHCDKVLETLHQI